MGLTEKFALVIETRRMPNDRYEHSVEVDRSDPIINALGEDYIANVKAAHIKALDGIKEAKYYRTRIETRKWDY